MYSTCLFCNSSLGANEVVETFPVGRRLAFDQRLGRLWVVCKKCAKWNLTPFEDRWEAIETCERLYRDARKRVSTEQIGLAKLPEGLELVRIGEPQRPEFAAWRYGDQFGRRRRRTSVFYGSLGVLGVVGTVGIIYQGATGAAIMGGGLFSLLHGVNSFGQLGLLAYRRRRVIGEVKDESGKGWKVRGGFAHALRLVPSDSELGWGLEIPGESGALRRRIVVEGPQARWFAGRIMPALTPDGGAEGDVRKAVARLEDHGDPEQFLRWLARNPRTRRDYMRRKDIVTGMRAAPSHAYDTMAVQGIDLLFATEMALNEENERRALEGELFLLEEAWKEAEEIAAISDKLALPAGVEERLSEIRSEADRNHT